MDGWAVLTAMKQDPDPAGIPVLMCTMLDDRSMGFALGASEFLTKPIDRTRLVSVLRKYGRPDTPGRVLVVEDDPSTREMMVRILEKEGRPGAQAENGRAALERVAAARPGLILMDTALPVLDGWGLPGS